MIITAKIPNVYESKSIHAKEFPRTILAIFECWNPSFSTILKYCAVSIANEKTKTRAAATQTDTFTKDFRKQ